MCGIAGILSFDKEVQVEQLKKMADVLVHRGPDGEGYWRNADVRVGFGHRRLSIIDLSETGSQPMHYAEGRYTITYNGEIYNYIELKEELKGKGYRFTSNSDTEVLLALYDLKKEKALNDLDGMFAFAIWDEKEKTLFCARDRFGEKPFYYHVNNKYFAFASEMKALFTLGLPRVQNKKKIYNYLLYATLEDSVDRSSTFYENIYQIEPSFYLTLTQDKKIHKQKYWDIKQDERTDLPEKEAIEKFRELFTLSVSRRLRSDVPVGSSLSGGLDSSSIVMLIDRLKKDGRVQKTFSARFKNFVNDEGRYMQMVIDKSNVEPHFVFPTVESAIENLKTISYHQEEPIGSTSIMAQYEVMKLAKENQIKVLLDGQGADEVLSGYKRYWSTYFNQLYRTDKGSYHSKKANLLQLYDKIPFQNNFAFKWRAYHPASYQFFAELKRKINPATSSYFLGIHPDMVTAYRGAQNPIPKPATLKEHLYLSLMSRGLDELLRYADRNAMANSVEVRLPFLYHTLVEFVFSLPDEMLLGNGWTKFILRKSMEDMLPPEIAWRKDKIGFEPPQKEWLKSKYFREYLKEAIAELKKEKIIVKEYPQLSWNYVSLFSFNHFF